MRTERITTKAIVLVAGGVFAAADVSAGQMSVKDAVIEAGPVRVVGTSRKEEEQVDLTSAKYIICVGRGIGTKENVDKVVAYAADHGAEIACTRPIAESEGWLARSRYVGVSGVTVKPDVYLALGVSGQVQHMVGVTGAKTIAAINKDKSAPIFKQCDFGLVADVDQVLAQF